MELGTFQLKWIEALEASPEKQGRKALGNKNSDTYCCQGMGLIIYNEMNNIPNLFTKDGTLCDTYIGQSGNLGHSFKKLGLRTWSGWFEDKELEYENHKFSSMITANDAGVPWSEIAKFMRENPEVVFIKSV